MRLAFQPAVYAADPSIIGFFEGFIRLLNLRDQVIPARDFMDGGRTAAWARDRLCGAADGPADDAAQSADPGLDQHVGAVGRLPALDRISCAGAAGIAAAGGEPDPGDQRGFGDAGAGCAAALHGRKCARHGIVFALDDFGAGMTSLGPCASFRSRSPRSTEASSHIDRPRSAADRPAAIAIAQEIGHVSCRRSGRDRG
jgi:hypothetical protein